MATMLLHWARVLWRRQASSAAEVAWKVSISPRGASSAIMAAVKWSWAMRSSSVMTVIWAVRAWRRAFWAERALPVSVRGPVDLVALARLAARRWGEMRVGVVCMRCGSSGGVVAYGVKEVKRCIGVSGL